MTTDAKIAALKEAAERKRQDALDRTNQAITKLVREGKPITFAAIAEMAEVSVAYLYKYDDLKARIHHLKSQQRHPSKVAQPQPASDRSKQAIVHHLRERIKKLKAENREFRHQNEIIYGRLCQLQEIEPQIQALKTQNANLKEENNWLNQQLDQLRPSRPSISLSPPIPNSNITLLATKHSVHSGLTDSIQAALADVGLPPNPTLAKTIQASPEAAVLAAIDALKEAMAVSQIERPGGWLKRAIEECWKPNEPLHQETDANPSKTFGSWFNLARAKGLVVASMKGEDEKIYVFDHQGLRYPFEQMLIKYPIESLKS